MTPKEIADKAESKAVMAHLSPYGLQYDSA